MKTKTKHMNNELHRVNCSSLKDCLSEDGIRICISVGSILLFFVSVIFLIYSVRFKTLQRSKTGQTDVKVLTFRTYLKPALIWNVLGIDCF